MKISSFNKLAKFTILAVFFVILAGGIVRMSGSGMGCPDWPKCFGQWVPPTSEADLPENYYEQFLEKRKDKVEKYLDYLRKFGMEDQAASIEQNPNLYREESFNPVKTWIEYVNRLFGFISGNLVLLLFILSLTFAKKHPRIVVFSFLALITITFQAWLGAVVVAASLTPWVVTIHMLLAIVLLSLLIWIFIYSGESSSLKIEKTILLPIILLVLIVQIVMGTQVRQEIDTLNSQLIERTEWIDSLSIIYYFHRSFSLVFMILLGFFFAKNQTLLQNKVAFFGIILAVGLEILAGIILSYMNVPSWSQPIHLILSFVLFSSLFYLWRTSKPLLN